MKKISAIFLFFLIAIPGPAQEINIIPKPVEIKISSANEKFLLNRDTKIVLNHGTNVERFSELLNEYLHSHYGFKLAVQRLSDNSTKNNIIIIGYNPLPTSDNKVGSYHLKSTKTRISLSSRYSNGLFYSIQTLIQLLPTERNNSLIIPQVEIYDYPRFAYRGMHLDVARHFFPVAVVKKYIDLLALHKLNTFHWHLTDDQGWRIEIKKYPKLTQVGSKRNGTIIGHYPGTGNDNTPHGGFYTQEQIKEVVKYAADRYITVIPEIEMPGHASAAIAAYPQLSCFPDEKTAIPGNMISETSTLRQARGDKKLVQETWGVFEDVFSPSDYTFNFLQDVMDEVMALFPSQYIHIGGDECPKEAWKRSDFCQQLIKEKGLKDEHGLQSYFIQRMEKYLNGKGKKIIGWDEILEGGLAPNATVMSWRGEQGGIDAAKQKHNVIMTPGNPVYFDHSQSENEDSVTIGGYNPIEKVYAYEPIPEELNEDENKYVLGAQANLWTEYINNSGKLEYMLLPRLAALSEVLWSSKEKRSWNDFEKRLQVQYTRYDLWKANYSKGYFDLKVTILPTEGNNGILLKADSKIESDGIYLLENSALPKFIKINGPIRITESGEKKLSLRLNNKTLSSFSQQFSFNKATGKKITLINEASNNYPGDGAFTLVNGVQNEKGLAKAKEFLGFNGTDCEAIIDLIKEETISSVTVHALWDDGAWIWKPKTLRVFVLDENNLWQSKGITNNFIVNGNGTITLEFTPAKAKQVKVIVENWGEIATGYSGAGSKSWLFIDEIEIN